MLLVAAVSSFCLLGLGILPNKASALSGSEFRPGNIIDDAVFYNRYSMSLEGIQAFLNSKVPVCDTNGAQPRGNTTRAAYGASVGHPPPYTCLKDYSESTPTKNPEEGLCSGLSAGNRTAARIIYDVAQSCGINPQALIVMLQKEQSLITDDWPWSTQYRSAMGYGCPDTAPCDAEYYGFFNQVYAGARQFKRYAKDSYLFNYRANRNAYVQYNPNAGCGGTNVFIENSATAGLYNYTPYQPNAAALNNLYGSGDGCSAYGNRNFWRLFIDWFGPTFYDPAFDNDNDGIVNKYDLCVIDAGRPIRWGCPPNSMNEAITYSGDFNGDGFGDIVSFSEFPDGRTFNVWLYKGSSTGLSNPQFQYTLGPSFGGWDFSRAKFGVANVNGDAYMDLVALHQGPNNEVTRHVLKGSSSGLQQSDQSWVAWQFPSQGWLWSNLRIAGGGDFNGDGYGDVSVISVDPNGQSFNVWLYNGSSSGLQNPTLQQSLGPNNGGWNFKKAKTTVTNVNGDTYMDLVVLHQGPDNEVVRSVLKGSSTGIQASDASMVGWQFPSQGWLWSNLKIAGGGGDYNGDGKDDLVVFSIFPDGKTFNVWLYPGSNSGLGEPLFQQTLGPAYGGWTFKQTKPVPTNVNGDSYLDLVAFHQGPGNEAVRHVLKGSSSGLQQSDQSWVAWQFPSQGWLWSNLRIAGGGD